jgi:hypothetical protein
MAGCVDFVPFGYVLDSGDNYQTSGNFYTFDVEFTVPVDGCQIWESRHTAISGGENWLVRIYGGVSETGGELEEPYIFGDRGAWFDGKYDLMTFELLKYGGQ